MSDKVAVLEGAAQLAVQKLKEIKAPAEAKAVEAQAKSDADKQKTEQVEKEKATKLESEKQAKLKEDARILSEDETKLKDEEKNRKTELIKAKEEEENTPEAKIKRVQEASQKRIDEIKSELLSERDNTKQEMATLRAELEELKKPKQQEDVKSRIKREHSEQISKYVDEDKVKPREDRREMTKDELDTWYLEDPTEATAWINRREIRRDREIVKLEETASKPIDNTAEKQKLLKEFTNKQNESRAKLFNKFPQLAITKDMVIEAKNAVGVPLDRKLTEDEATKVNDKLGEKNEAFRLCREISFSDPKKYIEATNGPELVMVELEKRLNGKSEENKVYTKDEVDSMIEQELERRKKVDGEGVTSTYGGKKVENNQKQKSELRLMQEKAAKKAGMTVEQLDARIARRGGIKGANSGADNEK